MKKTAKLLLALMLSACLLGAVSCGNIPDSTPSTESESDSETTETVPDRCVLLNEDGTSPYTFVYEDKRYDLMAKPTVQLKKAIETALGTQMNIATDFLDKKSIEEFADTPEILIGATNRPESEKALEYITDDTYVIMMIGSKLVIRGADNNSTIQAMQYFEDNLLSSIDSMRADYSYTGTYVPHPTSFTLTDNSTGKSEPRVKDDVVPDIYETEDVFVFDINALADGYAVSNDGKGDSTKGIQKALNDCASNGGGTVFLPAGRYCITGPITIPPYVTLRGDYNDPDSGKRCGTLIEYYGESVDTNLSGTFMLGGSGGVIGLTVYYPEQSLDEVKPYPFTFYTNGSGDNYMLSTVKNCTVINGYRGIGACCNDAGGAHEQLTVENFKGTFLLCGTEVYNQADVGTWQDVTINNKYWAEASGDFGKDYGLVSVDREKLDAYTKENTIGLILGDLEWTEFMGLYIDGCKTGVEITYGKRIQFAGSLYDVQITNCTLGVNVVELDARWGMVIANSTIEGGIENQTGGMVKLCNVKLDKEINNTRGRFKVYEDDTSAYTVDYKRSAPKPNDSPYRFFVVDAPKDGSEDVSAAVQALLDKAGSADAAGLTGGVVYLPGGIYRFDNPVVVPAGVELKGSSSVATRDQGGGYNGTLIYCYYGDDNITDPENEQAFITLDGEGAGLRGVRIRYPENTPYDKDRTSTYTVRGTAANVYVENCSIASSDLGIDFSNCDNFFIKKVTTCCYTNSYLLGGKGGMLTGCLQNGTVIQRCSAPGQVNTVTGDDLFPVLFDSILRPNATLIKVVNGENITLCNTFCYGCSVLVECENSTNVLGVNLGADNIGTNRGQIVMTSGDMAIINLMRYNGSSFVHTGGKLSLYNRITINDKREATYIEEK